MFIPSVMKRYENQILEQSNVSPLCQSWAEVSVCGSKLGVRDPGRKENLGRTLEPLLEEIPAATMFDNVGIALAIVQNHPSN